MTPVLRTREIGKCIMLKVHLPDNESIWTGAMFPLSDPGGIEKWIGLASVTVDRLGRCGIWHADLDDFDRAIEWYIVNAVREDEGFYDMGYSFRLHCGLPVVVRSGIHTKGEPPFRKVVTSPTFGGHIRMWLEKSFGL